MSRREFENWHHMIKLDKNSEDISTDHPIIIVFLLIIIIQFLNIIININININVNINVNVNINNMAFKQFYFHG